MLVWLTVGRLVKCWGLILALCSKNLGRRRSVIDEMLANSLNF